MEYYQTLAVFLSFEDGKIPDNKCYPMPNIIGGGMDKLQIFKVYLAPYPLTVSACVALRCYWHVYLSWNV